MDEKLIVKCMFNFIFCYIPKSYIQGSKKICGFIKFNEGIHKKSKRYGGMKKL